MTVWLRQPRIAAVMVVAAVVLALATASFARRVAARTPELGVRWGQSSRGAVAIHVEPASPAFRAGIREGDLLVSVDGRRIGNALDAGDLAWAPVAGDGLRLEVRHGAEVRSVVVRPESPHRGEPYSYLVLVGLAFWLSGLFAALRWPTVRGSRLYSLLAAALFLQLTMSHTGRADRLDWAVYWIDVVAAALVPALLMHAAVRLTRRAVTRPWALVRGAYAAAAGLILSAVWLSPSTLGGAYRFTDPVFALEVRDRVEMACLALAVVLASFLFVRSGDRSSSMTHRAQMRWLAWGIAAGLGPFVAFYAVPWAFGAADLPAWARFVVVLPMLVVPAAFTAALARYRLQDLDLFVMRAVKEVAAVFVTFAVLALAVFVFRNGVGSLVDVSRGTSRYLGILAAVLAYPQLRTWIGRGVDRAFYRQRYSYRATLLEWARELNAETDLQSLLEHLRARVSQTLAIPRADVLGRSGTWRFEPIDRDDGEGALELDPASLERLAGESYLAVERGALAAVPWARYLFPLKVKGQLKGLLAVADREDPDDPLNSEDRALLGTLAAHAGTAIEAARLVREVRHRAEEIEHLHARQEQILESSAVGLILLDADGRILAWNRAVEAVYGVARDEAIGRRLAEVLPLHVARRIEREPTGAAAAGEARIFRMSMVNRRGERVVVNVSISRAERGTAAGGRVVTLDDVTRRVRLEEQVLQQERLASLGLLAAGVAHEINTPLTGISSYAQMMLGELAGDDPRRETLEKICAQTERASSIANSLLTMARPDRTVFESLDLNDTVGEVVRLFAPHLRGREIRLQTELADDVPRIRGHRGKLQQVILNLLMNARDAVGEGGRIVLSTRVEPGGVTIEVADDGVGISEDDLPRIFDPFFTTKSRSKGTGLGLSISYGIVEEHDGRIRAACGADGRTYFRVTLPAERSTRAMA